MASEKTLNVKNLAALGAERLAELLLELAQGDAVMKHQLRLELASRVSGGDAAAEIRKRLASIAKSRSFVDWQKMAAFGRDLDMQRTAIMSYVLPTQPSEAFDLLWRMLELAPSVYERCDDSNGMIGGVMELAREDLGTVAAQTQHDPARLAARVFDSVCANDYGQFDGFIALMAKALGQDGLLILKAKFEALAASSPRKSAADERRVIGISTRGPIYQQDYETQRPARLVQSALTQIADALGDVDGYVARFSEEECANPATAASIAERLLTADRPDEAMAALKRAEAKFQAGGYWPDWQRVRIDALDALGLVGDAQSARWDIFEQALNAEYLRAFIKRLPDFDDVEAETRALAHVAQYPRFGQALSFLIDWPAHDRAADLVLARHDELDGNHYWLLTPGAETLEQRHPLAATLMLRAMIDYSLGAGKYKRYGHTARHLQTCEYLARRIESFGHHLDHEAYVADLRLRHGRKSGFWNA
ncbi:hypothetical protein NUH86_21980 [Sphingobium sp. JS3065]|uniref:DUF6880 family protein n=1 Tax=Sphingobium sp. JS3065 TaxID=2970925 RepID=UPI0022654F0A|nr:DUF6880 family protein [Sphingobium sp. JS3065]UZW57377.1 hypothetical protein NUH86_21980 [Sphingobium sp. JS3065]